MNGRDPISAQTLLKEHIAGLHEGRPRVWSIVITIFGDAIAPRGGEIRLSTLQQILDGLDIQSQATRAAMSRLAMEGWLTRQKSGRESIYALAQGGQIAFDQATLRIYRPSNPDWAGAFEVIVLANTKNVKSRKAELTELSFGELAPATFVRPKMEGQTDYDPRSDDIWFNCPAGGLTDLATLAERAWPAAKQASLYRSFNEKWLPFDASNLEDLNPLDALLARTLLVHDWRRIVLRDVDLPDALRPQDWPGRAARDLAANLYRNLVPASETWLDQCTGGRNGMALPEPVPDPITRFRP